MYSVVPTTFLTCLIFLGTATTLLLLFKCPKEFGSSLMLSFKNSFGGAAKFFFICCSVWPHFNEDQPTLGDTGGERKGGKSNLFWQKKQSAVFLKIWCVVHKDEN